MLRTHNLSNPRDQSNNRKFTPRYITSVLKPPFFQGTAAPCANWPLEFSQTSSWFTWPALQHSLNMGQPIPKKTSPQPATITKRGKKLIGWIKIEYIQLPILIRLQPNGYYTYDTYIRLYIWNYKAWSPGVASFMFQTNSCPKSAEDLFIAWISSRRNLWSPWYYRLDPYTLRISTSNREGGSFCRALILRLVLSVVCMTETFAFLAAQQFLVSLFGALGPKVPKLQ